VLRDYDLLSFETAPGEKMQGINTPTFVSVKTPSMPQGGLLAALQAAFSATIAYLSEALGPALLNFWNTFVGWMDTIFAWLGYPNLFSNAISWMQSLWVWVADSFAHLLSLLTSGFLFIASFLTKLLNNISIGVTHITNVITTFFWFFEQSWGYGESLWNLLNPIFVYGVILFCILYLVFVFSIWDEKGLDAMLNHLKLVLDILSWFGKLFLGVIHLFLDVIGRIIESIPVVE